MKARRPLVVVLCAGVALGTGTGICVVSALASEDQVAASLAAVDFDAPDSSVGAGDLVESGPIEHARRRILSPALCKVTAQNPHLSTSLAGAAGGTGQVKCRRPVATLGVMAVLRRRENDAWIEVGDRDRKHVVKKNAITLVAPTKEFPCVPDARYMTHAAAASFENGLIFTKARRSKALEVC